MYGYNSAVAFVVRLSIFMLLFSTYPLLNLMLRTQILNLVWPAREITHKQTIAVNAVITLGPLACACYFANIGSLLAYTGAISGFFAIYLLPVMVHLKRRYTQITNPLLAEAVSLNEFQIIKAS